VRYLHYCTARENLCESASFNGYQRDGGYAKYMVADARFCFSTPFIYLMSPQRR
jgi:propanol-preferring alcohol dehydrogenase